MTRRIYTIPSDVPFLRALAEGLAAQAGGLTPELAKFLVLLPTRRACRGLRDAFLELSNGKPLLLPRMQPLGDIDQEELDLRLTGLHEASNIPDIPPAMPPLKRLILLASLIQKRDSTLGHEQALNLATSLATLIDQVHTEDLDFSRLEKLVPDDLSKHWQETLQFLTIVTDLWPAILAEEGEIDPADRRNRLMKTLADSWQKYPPEYPIIAAGSTGSIPATAQLLNVISTAPQGCIILPGLDQALDEESWEALGDTHPQATMRMLLTKLETDRRRVEVWPAVKASSSPRPWLARELMRPAETIHEWAHLKDHTDDLDQSLATLDLVETKTQSEEAQTIAVIMRETLETPGKKAALVTPDRALARRVCAALRKWNIPVDDSAGSSLNLTPAGHLLDCIFACVIGRFAPSDLLNLLKHQSVHFINSNLLADFEIELCRGPRPTNGLQSLHDRAQALKTPRPDLEEIINKISAVFTPLQNLVTGQHSISDYLSALTHIVETLAGGSDKVWGREDGEAASTLISELMEQRHFLSPVDLASMHGILRQLMQGIPVRHPVIHPRLIILGQLEARMIETDVMILGSLNEGSWPAEPAHDPWMSRPMRQQFGLPSPERSVGLAAHDFVQALCSPRVVLTRSEKVEGTPTVPSRWLERFATMLKAVNLAEPLNETYPNWARQLQHSASPAQPAPRPEPQPPINLRPKILSATWIERWMRNPYQVYVRKILKLEPLDALEQDTTAAELGSVVHAILKDFIAAYPDVLPPNVHAEFLRIARARMDDLESDPVQKEFWWPRLETLASWVIENEKNWRKTALPWKQEIKGEHKIPFARGDFTLFAVADRIDRLKDNSFAIIDYKTGSPPSAAEIRSGESCQLPLEGLILRNGGYDKDIREVSYISFWKLLGNKSSGDIKDYTDTTEMIDQAERGLLNLIQMYEDPQTPYIAKPPKNPNRIFEDERAMAHLARTAEWASTSADEGEEAA